jgi:hypothetical protein
LPDILTNLPEQKRVLLEALVTRLSQIPGMAAIVLGGSYASGTHHETSDLDIGPYYFAAQPFLIEDIRRIAQAVSMNGVPTITDFFEGEPGSIRSKARWISCTAR